MEKEIIYTYDINSIICGDCLDIMQQIPDKSVDMVLCDPPYGTTGELKWDAIIPFDKMWEQYNRIVKDNGAILLFASEPFTSKLIMSNLKMFKYRWTWEKKRASNYMHAKQQPLRACEDICVFYKKQPTYNPQFTFGEPYVLKARERLAPAYGSRGKEFEIKSEDGRRYPRNVIRFNNLESEHKRVHPTQKPLDLLTYMIKTYTNEGDTILDNCAGSFSTAVAAEQNKRNWICIEKEIDYCKIAQQRFNLTSPE